MQYRGTGLFSNTFLSAGVDIIKKAEFAGCFSEPQYTQMSCYCVAHGRWFNIDFLDTCMIDNSWILGNMFCWSQ